MEQEQSKKKKQSLPYRKLVNIEKITREEWLEWRRKGIGGSDAGKILGVSSFGSAFSVYNDKLNLSEPIEITEVITEGNYFEDGTARRCQDNHPELKVRKNPYMLQSKQYPYMLADLDREAVKEDGSVIGIEIKNPSIRNKTKFADGDIVESWYYQVLHYMAVTGYKEYILAICHLSVGYFEFHFHLDEKDAWAECKDEPLIKQFDVLIQQSDIDELIKREGEFWNEYVVKKQLPPPDGTKSYTESYLSLHAQDDGSEIDITFLSEICAEYVKTNKEIESLIEKKDSLKQQLILSMGDSAKGKSDYFKISFSTAKGKETLDKALLMKKYPAIYEECKKIGNPSRTLRVYEVNQPQQ